MSDVVIYARYSSHKQREESIEGQIRLCSKYAEDHDMNVVREFIDRAETGKTFKDRPGAMQLIEESKKKKFTAVLVYKFDRFSRDEADFYYYQKILKKNGVRIISISEDVGEGAQSILITGVHTSYNAYYSAELAEKVTRGMTENAIKGTYNGSYRTYGYDIIEKRYVVNEVEATVVKKIFEKYAQGETVRSILDWCEERGYKNQNFRDFDYGFIDRMLKNEKYIGILKWDDIVSENSIKPIVEKELFDKAQKRLNENSNVGARAKAIEPYVLVGKAFCGLCEEPLVADSVKKRQAPKAKTPASDFGFTTFTMPIVSRINDEITNSSYKKTDSDDVKTYRYYACRGQKQTKHKNGCCKKRMDKDALENAVISYTAKQYLIDENLTSIAKAILKLQRRAQADPNIKDIENKIQEENKKINNLLNLFEKGIQDDDTTQRYLQAQVRKKDLEEELKNIKSSSTTLDEKAVYDRLYLVKRKMLEYIKKGEIPLDVKKAFCDAFINKVYVFDEDGTDGNDRDKKIKVKIVFDAFESEGLLGFDDAEIELSSISDTFGSPQTLNFAFKVFLFKIFYLLKISY